MRRDILMLFALAALLTVCATVPSAAAGEENEEFQVVVDPPAPPGESLPSSLKSLSAAATSGAPPVAVIDILALYTRARRDHQGGVDAMWQFLQQQVANANAVEANSGTGIQYRLLGAREVGYAEAGDLHNAFEWLSDNPEISRLRDGLGADLVSLFVTYSGGGPAGLACGTAHPDCPWSALATAEVGGPYLAAHEWGHNRELDHDVDHESSDSRYNNNHGNYWEGSTGAYRDVMAYPDGCWDELGQDCPVVPLYASPSILFDGVPTGVKGVSEAAEVAALTGPKVAAYRLSQTVARFIARWFPAERRMTVQIRVPPRPGETGGETVELYRGPLKNGQPQGRPFAKVALQPDGAGVVTVIGWKKAPAFISGKTSRGTTFQRFVRTLGS